MPKITAIVFDPATNTVTFSRVRKVKDTKGGKVAWASKNGAVIIQNVFLRDRNFPFSMLAQKRYVWLKSGDPRPLTIASNAKPMDYDASMFQAAIESTIATRFLKGGVMDWRTILMLFLGFLVLVLVGIVAMLSGQITAPPVVPP